MTTTIKHLRLALGLSAIICAVLALFTLFNAGCAGDAKSGALGNPVQALQLENLGFLIMLCSAITGGITAALIFRSVHRIAQGIRVALLLFAFLWLIGLLFENWGIQSCFAINQAININPFH